MWNAVRLFNWQRQSKRMCFVVCMTTCSLSRSHSIHPLHTPYHRQAQWALFFTRFNFQATYRSGDKNCRADALSRFYQADPEPSVPEPILPPAVLVNPIQWTINQQITNENLQNPGRRRTLSLLKQRYWWPSMSRDVSRYVQGCSVCAVADTPGKLPEGKLVPLPIPERPWTHIGVDFMTDLPPSQGYTSVLVVVDRFSKSCKLIPLKGLPTALQTAEALFHQVFRHFGLPGDIVSDRGPQFISRVWNAFFRLLGVSISLSSGYHPQTNGQTERKIQEVGRFLRLYCHQNQDSWSQYLPWAEYAQNSLRQTTTGLTPFQCVLGYQPPLFPWSGEPSEVPAVNHWFQQSERVWD
uniref:Gypsy retrotransposon integrase-like protein 1 n=1 Tax=Cyprinus carpio TaxID=7962 RepID=A0A8C1RXQ5_CYPCA